MKSSIKKQITESPKTTLIGYIVAVLLAIQPLINVEIDFTKRIEVIKYLVRLVVAAVVAFLSKYVADHTLEKNRTAE